jgi:ABC-type sulfate/molybdate transport systems ATPase subunit
MRQALLWLRQVWVQAVRGIQCAAKFVRIEARSFLAKMHQEIGVTTVYVTHDQSEAMMMGDTVVAMRDGAEDTHNGNTTPG